MVAIKNNRSQITINTHNESLKLMPGVNLNIDDEKWERVSKHPMAQNYLNDGILEIIKEKTKVKGELQGFTVTEDKETDEPLPITNQNESKSKSKSKPKSKGRPRKNNKTSGES